MARISCPTRKKRRLRPGKLSLRERIASSRFASRITRTSRSKRTNQLFHEIKESLTEYERIRENAMDSLARENKFEVEQSKRTDAMFLFLKGMESGIIFETEQTRKLEDRILGFEEKLAAELKRKGLKTSGEQQKNVVYLISLLLPERVVSELLREKREIDEEIREFAHGKK